MTHARQPSTTRSVLRQQRSLQPPSWRCKQTRSDQMRYIHTYIYYITMWYYYYYYIVYTWDDDNIIQNGRGHGDDGRHNTTSLSRRRRHMNASHLYRRSCIDDMHVYINGVQPRWWCMCTPEYGALTVGAFKRGIQKCEKIVACVPEFLSTSFWLYRTQSEGMNIFFNYYWRRIPCLGVLPPLSSNTFRLQWIWRNIERTRRWLYGGLL
jgi:hypothetical protein